MDSFEGRRRRRRGPQGRNHAQDQGGDRHRHHDPQGRRFERVRRDPSREGQASQAGDLFPCRGRLQPSYPQEVRGSRQGPVVQGGRNCRS